MSHPKLVLFMLFAMLLTVASLPLLGQSAAPLATPQTNASGLRENPIITVQKFINYQSGQTVMPEDGQWTAPTVNGLKNFLASIEKANLWGTEPWSKTHPVDGIYSDQLASYLRQALEVHSRNAPTNPEFLARFRGFLDVMDELKADHILDIKALPSQTPVQALPPANPSPSTTSNVVQPLPASQAAIPSATSSLPASANPVVTVQEFLRSQQQSHVLAVTGYWNAETAEHVSGFVQSLERNPLSAYPWTGPADGVYSDAFSAYLKHAVAVMKRDRSDDQAWASQLESFSLAMDELKQKGVYQETNSADAQDSPKASSSDAFGDIEQSFKPAFLWFLNGMLSDFGDEAWCALFHGAEGFSGCHQAERYDLQSFDASYHILAMILYFVGALYNPITLTLIQHGIKKDASPPYAMLWGFWLGLIDFFIYFVGDLWTRQFSFKGFDLGLIFVSAIFAMIVTSFCISLQLSPTQLITWRPKA